MYLLLRTTVIWSLNRCGLQIIGKHIAGHSREWTWIKPNWKSSQGMWSPCSSRLHVNTGSSTSARRMYDLMHHCISHVQVYTCINISNNVVHNCEQNALHHHHTVRTSSVHVTPCVQCLLNAYVNCNVLSFSWRLFWHLLSDMFSAEVLVVNVTCDVFQILHMGTASKTAMSNSVYRNYWGMKTRFQNLCIRNLSVGALKSNAIKIALNVFFI